MYRTLCFHFSGPAFDPRLGNWDPTGYVAWPPKINNDNKYDVDIELEVSKGFPWKNIIKYTIILGSIIIVVFGAIYYVYNKNKRTNSIDWGEVSWKKYIL